MSEIQKDAIQRRDEALEVARRFGTYNELHHKAWVVDQMCRILLGDEYDAFIAEVKNGDEGPDTYEWDVGIIP